MTEMEEIKLAIKHLEEQNQRILLILENDNKTNQKGLVARSINNEKRIEELETFNTILKTKISTYGFIGGAVGGVVIYTIKVLVTKNF